MGARYTQRRTDPAEALRRIEKLEAERRRVQRSRGRCTPGSDYARELDRQTADLDERLTRWREFVARAEAGGFKVWSRGDFRRGDRVQYRDAWYEVLRVNAKSLTVRDDHLDRTWAIAYTDGITGHMGPDGVQDPPASQDG